jgi:hypothetical protein
MQSDDRSPYASEVGYRASSDPNVPAARPSRRILIVAARALGHRSGCRNFAQRLAGKTSWPPSAGVQPPGSVQPCSGSGGSFGRQSGCIEPGLAFCWDLGFCCSNTLGASPGVVATSCWRWLIIRRRAATSWSLVSVPGRSGSATSGPTRRCAFTSAAASLRRQPRTASMQTLRPHRLAATQPRTLVPGRSCVPSSRRPWVRQSTSTGPSCR